MFASLFDRRLKPEPAFAEALRAAGYDPSAPQRKYPTTTWVACLGVARRFRYAELDEASAYRAMGQEFTQGFLSTVVGKLIDTAVSEMRPLSFINRLGQYFSVGRTGEALRYQVVEGTVGHALVEVRNPSGVPGAFVAGIIDRAMERMKVAGTTVVNQKTPTQFSLDVSWKDR